MSNPNDFFPEELPDKPIRSRTTKKLSPEESPDDYWEDPFGFIEIEDLSDAPIGSQPTEEYPPENMQDQQPDPSSTVQIPDNQGFVIPPIEPDVVEPPQDTRSSGKDRISHLIRRFSPVLVPLPFAILIFLFTLPFALRGQVFLPLLPLAILLIALVVMQGTLLYYAGSNDTYWTLFVIIGYALFLVVGTLAIFGFAASLILLFILLIIGTFLARRSIRQVPEGYVDIVMMYGKYARTLYPGLNLKIPWEKVRSRLNTKGKSWTCPEQVVKISRDHDLKLMATISYQLMPEDAHLAALQVDNWETSLQKLFVATIQSVINELTPSDFMNWPQGTHARTSVGINSLDAATIPLWDRINDILTSRIQDQVARWGVQVNYVRIQDITLIPHLAPSLNPVVGMPERQAPVDVGRTRGGYPAEAQLQQAQMAFNPGWNQPVPMPVQPSPATAQARVSAADIEMLVESYEAVRIGSLKDPHTIRDIAGRFESLANDPNIDFDALKAAQILYHRAWIYEQKARVPDEPIWSMPEESRSVWYPPIEGLPLKPPRPQYPMQPPPANETAAQPEQPGPLEVGESPVTGREEALAIKFAFLKLIDYLFFLLLVLELIFLARLLLKLIGANQNNWFAGFLYGLSDFLLLPFSGIAPSVFIHPLNQSLEISTLVGMFVYFIVFFLIARFLKILISSPKSIEEELDLEPPKDPDEKAFVSRFAITQVKSFYQNVRSQLKHWLFFSVIVIILGTLCIISIYIVPYLGKFFPISENTTSIITSIIAGSFLYIIALLSYLQNREAYKQVSNYYNDKLLETEKISQLITLASRTSDAEAREHMNEKIISQILLPLENEKFGKDKDQTVSNEMPTLDTLKKRDQLSL